MKIASFFSGAGGMDLGFRKAGFQIPFANEYDKSIWATYEHNHPKSKLDRRSIVDIPDSALPPKTYAGFIGGPPCQSWSEAGARRGIEDQRGRLFFEYIRLLKHARPLFFVAENVSGILFSRHNEAFEEIKRQMSVLGYELKVQMLNANDYEVPQDRHRVFIVGYHKRLRDALGGKSFEFPEKVTPSFNVPSLEDDELGIMDLAESAMPAIQKSKPNPRTKIANHEYMTGGHSSIFMSRNRVRSWDEPSFTIQAGGRHAPLHPSAPKMTKVRKDLFEFKRGKEKAYRRLSVRECARIQTFPNDFEFIYKDLNDGYKMIGNAVPVNLAYHVAKAIYKDVKASGLTA